MSTTQTDVNEEATTVPPSPSESAVQRRSVFSKLGVTSSPPPAPAEKGRTFRNETDAIAAFNSQFCYVRAPNAIVRLRDYEIFKPDLFIKHQYGNWRIKVEESDTTRPATTRWML